LITAEDLKPSCCNGLYLTNIVRGSGVLNGTAANDLIIGGDGPDIIDGLGGDDCILGGSGDDMITGGDGTDICIGGAGNNIFTACENEN
jgi:Ca2+-binding RTX toxin-like protein